MLEHLQFLVFVLREFLTELALSGLRFRVFYDKTLEKNYLLQLVKEYVNKM